MSKYLNTSDNVNSKEQLEKLLAERMYIMNEFHGAGLGVETLAYAIAEDLDLDCAMIEAYYEKLCEAE